MPLWVTIYNHCVQELKATACWSPGDVKVSCVQSFLYSTVPMEGVPALFHRCGVMAQSHQQAIPDTRYPVRQPVVQERAGSV